MSEYEDLSSQSRFNHGEGLSASSLSYQLWDVLQEQYYIVDFNWRFLYVNLAAANYARKSREEIIGKTVLAVLPGITGTDLYTSLQKCLLERLPQSLESQFIDQDGNLSYFNFRIEPIPEGLLYTALDVSTLKIEQNKLNILNRLYAVLSQTNQAAMKIKDRDSLFRDICRIIVEIGQFRTAWFGLFDSNGIVKPVVNYGYDAGIIRYFAHNPEDFSSALAYKAMDDSIKQGRLVILDKLARDLNPPGLQKLVTQSNYHSVAVIPLTVCRKALGALSILSERDSFLIEEQVLLQKIQDTLSFALETLELEKERQKAERKLAISEERFRKITEVAQDLIYRLEIHPCLKLDYISPSLSSILGYSFKDLKNDFKHILKLMHPEDRAFILDRFNTPEIQIDEAPLTIRWLHRDGHIVSIEHRNSIITDKDTGTVSIIGIGRDISERLKAQSSLIQSENTLRSLLNALPNPALLADRNLNYVILNQALAGASNKKVEDLLGTYIFSLLPPEVAEFRKRQMEQVFITGEALVYEDDTLRPSIYYLNPVFNSQHEVEQVAVVIVDISQRKRTEQALRLSEEKFSKAFHSSPTIMCISTLKEGRFLECNEAFKANLGFKLEYAMGRASLELNIWSQESREIILRAIEEKGEIHVGEFNVSTIEGKTLTCIGSFARIEIGDIPCLLTNLIDITEQKQAQKELEESYLREKNQRQELEAEAKSRGMFIDVLAHELRTPLTPILASTEMLKDMLESSSDSLQKKLSVNIFNSAQTLTRRLEELLDVARYSRGTFKLNLQPVDLNKFIQDVISRFEPSLKLRNQHLALQLSPAMPVANIDPSRLEQVIINLLSNASKFSPENDDIIFKCLINNQALLVEVHDHGIGISPEEQNRLFLPYHRVEQDRQKYPGIGLGLVVAKQIIEAHGGSIWLSSQPRQGSIFSFRVPINNTMP